MSGKSAAPVAAKDFFRNARRVGGELGVGMGRGIAWGCARRRGIGVWETAGPWGGRSGEGERAVAAQFALAEGFDAMAGAVGEGEVQAVVRDLVELQRAAHLETEATAEEHERDVVERVAVAFAEFVTDRKSDFQWEGFPAGLQCG